MLNIESFIKRLHKILDYYHLSAATFADEINVQRSSISHLLSGRNKPSLEFVLKITNHYKEINLDWLLHGKGDFPVNKKIENQTPIQNLSSVSSAEKRAPSPITDIGIKKTTPSEIERIVVFYKNGTFKEYSEM